VCYGEFWMGGGIVAKVRLINRVGQERGCEIRRGM